MVNGVETGIFSRKILGCAPWSIAGSNGSDILCYALSSGHISVVGLQQKGQIADVTPFR